MNVIYLLILVATVLGLFIVRLVYVRQRDNKLLLILDDYSIDFEQALNEFDELLSSSFYLSDMQYQLWRGTHNHLFELMPTKFEKIKNKNPLILKVRIFLDYYSRGRELFIDPHNINFVQNEIPVIKHVLNEKKIPCNNDQLTAIASDENNTLLVAGAGTGKTTTIVGKLAYLIERLDVEPKDILLLSFTGRAVNELSDRVAKKFANKYLEVRTFHSFGLSIIGQVRGKKPELAFDGDSLKRKIFLNNKFNSLLSDKSYTWNVLQYFAYYFKPISDEPVFENLDEYHQKNLVKEYISLKNEKMKSQQEVMIANYLFLNGISYVYEAPYKHETATKFFRQYKPDFYLPDFDIYIEHFGIDKNGMVHFTRNEEQNYKESIKYRADMEWKHDLHKQYQTKLIETYSYDFFENDWEKILKEKLLSEKVLMKSMSAEDIISIIKKENYDIKKIAELFATFLDLSKSRCYTPEILREIIIERQSPRELAFLKIFVPLYEEYENYIKESGTVDFHDMLLEAADYISDGRYPINFKYVIIDEFQDFSESKSKLIKAICAQNPFVKLFCVGDDWQSIFRFAGSDVSLMSEFQDNYGFTRKNQLAVTNRFNDQLAIISNQFILKNPSQIHKEVSSSTMVNFDPVQIVHEKNYNDTIHFLSEILSDLDKKAKCANKKLSILLLGRYKHNAPENWQKFNSEFGNLSVEFLTIHAAKGSEADYVIILDVNSGRYGFPSEISDDPILNIVLSKREEYPNAEERRLMYVAMTRAKQKVFIMTKDGAESIFVLELERSNKKNKEKIICPECGGNMVRRKGPYGAFLSCKNYPKCKYKINLRRYNV